MIHKSKFKSDFSAKNCIFSLFSHGTGIEEVAVNISGERKEFEMTLLPIIYTSLIFFFSLMVLVLLVSYITFKLRKQENPAIVEERNKVIQNQYNYPKPATVKPYYQYYEKPRGDIRPVEVKKPQRRSSSHRRHQITTGRKRIEIINEKYTGQSDSYNSVFINNYAD